LEHHSVDALLGQLHGVKPDAADLVALALYGDVKPILLFHRVAFPLIVTSGVA